MLLCSFHWSLAGSVCLSRSGKKTRPVDFSRRKFLQYCQGAPLALLPSGFPFRSFLPAMGPPARHGQAALPAELQLHPEYRLKRGIEAVLRKLPAGFDEFVNEKAQDRIAAI